MKKKKKKGGKRGKEGLRNFHWQFIVTRERENRKEKEKKKKKKKGGGGEGRSLACGFPYSISYIDRLNLERKQKKKKKKRGRGGGDASSATPFSGVFASPHVNWFGKGGERGGGGKKKIGIGLVNWIFFPAEKGKKKRKEKEEKHLPSLSLRASRQSPS